MTQAPQRIDDGAPPVIGELFGLPYLWAAETLQGAVVEVGGGAQRLGKRLLEATDVDADPACGNDVTCSATALPFPDNSFDHAICFETVEHVTRPLLVVSELIRVARRSVLLGSVNSAGPTWLPGGVAIWKGADNPHHVSEMDTAAFCGLLAGLDVDFFGSMQVEYPYGSRFAITPGAHPTALVNYARITLA